VQNGPKIAHFLNKTLDIKRLFDIFTDIRKKPTISLRTILLSLFLMPFYGMTSLLALDRLARMTSYRKLFDCSMKAPGTDHMVVSDTTIARILRWLGEKKSQSFLLRFVDRFNELGLLEKALAPLEKPRRIGIIDGSGMGGHFHVTLSLHGSIDCPAMVQPTTGKGKELPAAYQLLDDAYQKMRPYFPDLLLCDSLYFNANAFKSVRDKGAHILVKSSNPDFRTVLQDAKFLFDNKDSVLTPVQTDSGFDDERFCHWNIEIASGEFAGYPVLIAHLVEDYPKRTKNAHCECWIVTTDLSLSSFSLREAAHLRWHIENNVFKRLSHLTGTKRFYFKDPRRFYTMLRIFLAAIASIDALICILRHSKKEFKRLLNGQKFTWKNFLSRLQDQIECADFRW